MLLDMIIIKCSSQFQDKRSVAAIFHLLKGRKSIQTQQDAFLYDLQKFYGIYKKLSKQSFNLIINQLQDNGYLHLYGGSVLSGKKGTAFLQKMDRHRHVPYLNGMKYSNADTIFCQRLFLLIQTLTNSWHNHFSFIPVVDTPQITGWVKDHYKQMKPKHENVLYLIHKELQQLLERFPEADAEFFVDCLAGFEHYGMSSYQLAKHHELERLDVPLHLTAIVHRMFWEMEQEPGKFPIISYIIKDVKQETKLSQSASKTDILLRENHNPAEIARIRNLKINTVYDHIVEIALYEPNFPIDAYISNEQQEKIAAAIRKAKSFKLKDIKSGIDDEISYFQIRLVLATHHKGVR
ncbi:helix-turn-helix domain-containing protein [Virgibacillus ihumii]|uniref:helix-turn-helix domain-containing protein n=1 Tax=Virgibacillus ihumii TaxID=2686091 RepID=UPI00157C0D13|nr:helix-turn-helix domain-containing protein [Virgibacillus ihumii]